jgi:endonuclease/exonuclease/phosphatase family metal-dependent hydrolase
VAPRAAAPPGLREAGSIVAARMRTTIARLSRRRLLASSAVSIALASVLRSLGVTTSAQSPASPGSEPPEPLAVMSFNIRYGTADDGENRWANRREMLFALLRTENSDLIGLQEALRFQIDEILAAVPGYGVVGVGRDDGKAAGEMSAILFRTARFHVAASGTFWFSDTPEIPASKTWGNRITRIASWARFVDRDGTAFSHYNLHLDHESQPSREKSTTLLLQRIAARPVPSEPVIVTGDFNAGESNPALHVLVGAAAVPASGAATPAAGAPLPPFIDTFRAANRDEKEVGTFTGFVFGRTSGEKIDYVLVQPGTEVLAAAIVRTGEGGRYPSDHFPVTARLRLAAAGR